MTVPEKRLICLFLETEGKNLSNSDHPHAKEYTMIALTFDDLKELSTFKVPSLPHSVFVVDNLLVFASCENMISIQLNDFVNNGSENSNQHSLS